MKRNWWIPLLVLALVVVGAAAFWPWLRSPRFAQPQNPAPSTPAPSTPAPATPAPSSNTGQGALTSVKVSTAPVIDGKMEQMWNQAKPVDIPVSGGFAGDIAVSMRSIYTGDSAYFLLQWSDQELSQRRMPWVYNGNGKFTAVPAAPSGFNPSDLANWTRRPAGYAYEDKAAIIWNINNSTKNFNNSGCSVACHPDASPRPLKYTNADGELLDMWHWKLVRTDPYAKLDDQYVDNTSDVKVNANAGRKGDPGGPEYEHNEKPDKSGPAYVSKDKLTAPPYGIRNENKREITDADIANLKQGDEVASVIIGTPAIVTRTDRSDVDAKGFYDEQKKMWTLEIGRKLTTGSKFDVQFDPKNSYFFGVAIFNNAQIEHSYSSGAYRLEFR